jgi:hypothetical protein
VENADFCALVEETTGLHIQDLIFEIYYRRERKKAFPLLTMLANLNSSFDDVTFFFQRAYALGLPLGLIESFKEKAKPLSPMIFTDINKEPDWGWGVSVILNQMLINPSFVDAVFDLLMRGKNSSVNFKGMLYGFGHKDSLRNQRKLNLCRYSVGVLREPEAFLLFPRNQTIARMFCDSAMAADDLQAVQHLLSIPQMAKHLPQAFLADHVKVVNNRLISDGHRTEDLTLINAITRMSLEDYAKLVVDSPLLQGKNRQPQQTLDAIFNVQMLRKAPDEFVHLLMTTSNFEKDPVNAFIYGMHRAGLPTARGFLMANHGRFYMLEHPDFCLTEPEIVNICYSNKHRRGYLGILATLAPEIIAGHKEKDLLLDLVYKLSEDTECVRHMSLIGRAKAFSGDIGL